MFKGHHAQEFTWFSPGASLPFTSTSAERAAKRIVRGITTRETELIVTWQANLLARAHALMPGFTTGLLTLVNALLPGRGGIGTHSATGRASRTPLTDSPLEHLGQSAAQRLNQ